MALNFHAHTHEPQDIGPNTTGEQRRGSHNRVRGSFDSYPHERLNELSAAEERHQRRSLSAHESSRDSGSSDSTATCFPPPVPLTEQPLQQLQRLWHAQKSSSRQPIITPRNAILPARGYKPGDANALARYRSDVEASAISSSSISRGQQPEVYLADPPPESTHRGGHAVPANGGSGAAADDAASVCCSCGGSGSPGTQWQSCSKSGVRELSPSSAFSSTKPASTAAEITMEPRRSSHSSSSSSQPAAPRDDTTAAGRSRPSSRSRATASAACSVATPAAPAPAAVPARPAAISTERIRVPRRRYNTKVTRKFVRASLGRRFDEAAAAAPEQQACSPWQNAGVTPRGPISSGGNLADAMQLRCGRVSEDEVRTVASRLAARLARLHGTGRLHRDVSLGSVLMDDPAGFHTCRLADTGQGGVLGWDGCFRDRSMVAGHSFLAPEMRPDSSGAVAYTVATDLWAFGALLLSLLSGHAMPFGSQRGPWCNMEGFPGPGNPDRLQRWLDAYLHHMMNTACCRPHWQGPSTSSDGGVPPPRQPVSLAAQDLVCQLLRADPAQRLSAPQVLEHPWLGPGRGSRRNPTPSSQPQPQPGNPFQPAAPARGCGGNPYERPAAPASPARNALLDVQPQQQARVGAPRGVVRGGGGGNNGVSYGSWRDAESSHPQRRNSSSADACRRSGREFPRDGCLAVDTAAAPQPDQAPPRADSGCFGPASGELNPNQAPAPKRPPGLRLPLGRVLENNAQPTAATMGTRAGDSAEAGCPPPPQLAGGSDDEVGCLEWPVETTKRALGSLWGATSEDSGSSRPSAHPGMTTRPVPARAVHLPLSARGPLPPGHHALLSGALSARGPPPPSHQLPPHHSMPLSARGYPSDGYHHSRHQNQHHHGSSSHSHHHQGQGHGVMAWLSRLLSRSKRATPGREGGRGGSYDAGDSVRVTIQPTPKRMHRGLK